MPNHGAKGNGMGLVEAERDEARGDAGCEATSPGSVLEFWLDEVGPERWYERDDALDDAVRTRFASVWERGREGALSSWLSRPDGALAFVILMDQFPRNMWRGQARAFATDRAALAAAKTAVDRDWDLRVDEPARQFFYLPMMHSECLPDQSRCVRLMHDRLRETGASNLLHARAHREVIRRFGRFPHRNEALGRADVRGEAEFLARGGYGAVVRDLKDGEGGAS